MSANQKIILAIFIVYLALNAAIGIIFSNRQNKKQHTSSEKKVFYWREKYERTLTTPGSSYNRQCLTFFNREADI